MIRIRSTTDSDTAAIRSLCREGLREHFREDAWDDDRNEDLKDPLAYYQGRVLVAVNDADEIVGTGALMLMEERAFICRVSVRTDVRRRAVGRTIVAELESMAAKNGFTEIELETTATWEDICAFWKNQGYEATVIVNGDQYFRKKLTGSPTNRRR